ncbi:MAG: hydrolase 1, exosortase A system-associated [Sphingomonas sp. 28-62-20]|uniref:hydrolase 1, exosortase A system-associated n=1 Tax=Sphingomonas sp. 28-62-20 TaxID=1970433 RepID=UPI000BCDA4C0|nr:MAG: hydrolase 1, exosortase A system-associated [Sphingomonas sp. 28-62-20]
MRKLITFPCQGETLVGSLDEAPGTTGLLIISGGNEIRCGAHRGMALLAAELAVLGTPVFRFDRRGIGDSTGENGGFASSGPDVMAAVTAFRAAAPQVKTLVGFGNCDAATALLLHGGDAFDRLILANPWVIEQNDDLPPAAAIRARYADRLRDPTSWRRMVTGQVNIGKLVSGLAKVATAQSQLSSLERAVFEALAAHRDARVILAAGDATAIAFADAARRLGHDAAPIMIDTASHSFARQSDKAALRAAIMAALA